MRCIVRKALPKVVEQYLSRKRRDVAITNDVERAWKNARRTKAILAVFKCLLEMSGKRQRCMYCEDSRGTTIEHFWPKSVYKAKCFLWDNMLLLCQGCQSHKGNRFYLDSTGEPLLINPTQEDPWDFLFFEASTGILTARYEAALDAPNPKGEHTTDAKVLPLNIEAVTEGRLRTKNNLQRAVRTFLRDVENGSALGVSQDELIQAIQENDDYGLSVWFFLKDGKEDSPFSHLRLKSSPTWERVQQSLKG